MSKVEAMRRHWPDHTGWCGLLPTDWRGRQCGVKLVPLTVDSDYLSVRCPSCRVVTIHQRVVPLNR